MSDRWNGRPSPNSHAIEHLLEAQSAEAAAIVASRAGEVSHWRAWETGFVANLLSIGLPVITDVAVNPAYL